MLCKLQIKQMPPVLKRPHTDTARGTNHSICSFIEVAHCLHVRRRAPVRGFPLVNPSFSQLPKATCRVKVKINHPVVFNTELADTFRGVALHEQDSNVCIGQFSQQGTYKGFMGSLIPPVVKGLVDDKQLHMWQSLIVKRSCLTYVFSRRHCIMIPVFNISKGNNQYWQFVFRNTKLVKVLNFLETETA